VDVPAGRDAVLELTAGNAEVEPITAATSASAAPLQVDSSALVMQWQDSILALWTPTTRATGFVVDLRGLIATNQRGIGTATSVEVQLTPAVKVMGNVVVSDRMRDVAIVSVDPKVLAGLRPVPIGCGLPAKAPLVDGQEILTIEVPLREQKGVASGVVSRVEPHGIVSELKLGYGGAGGPVFAADGAVVGITSLDEENAGRRGQSPVVRISEACEVLAVAEKKIKDAAPPAGTPLPVEPLTAISVDALQEAARRRLGNLSPYQMSSSDFDIAFITPVLAYGAQHQSELGSNGDRGRGARRTETFMRPSMDFSNWADYVAESPPVLLVRVTPKLVEGFWTKIARGAAQTQGAMLPPIKHFKSGFSRLRAYCGSMEVTPIHPFRLEQRLSEADAIYEGLYVFDPGALAPECGSVKFIVYSEKDPEKGDTRVVDPKVLEQIWEDFAPYRALK
jgi:S1-C subfamily serine protease